jgi:hypothetical protein
MRQSYGCSASKSWGHERNGALSGGTRASSFAATIDDLERFAERLRGVQIEHLDWRELLAHYDAPGVCFYLDPPYHRDPLAPGTQPRPPLRAHDPRSRRADRDRARTAGLRAALRLRAPLLQGARAGGVHPSRDPPITSAPRASGVARRWRSPGAASPPSTKSRRSSSTKPPERDAPGLARRHRHTTTL